MGFQAHFHGYYALPSATGVGTSTHFPEACVKFCSCDNETDGGRRVTLSQLDSRSSSAESQATRRVQNSQQSAPQKRCRINHESALNNNLQLQA